MTYRHIKTPFEEGESAGFLGEPRASNPYLKGLEGPHLEWAEQWNNGYMAGKKAALVHIMVKHLESLRGGFNADNLE